jgi:hypothetical protein
MDARVVEEIKLVGLNEITGRVSEREEGMNRTLCIIFKYSLIINV